MSAMQLMRILLLRSILVRVRDSRIPSDYSNWEQKSIRE